MPVGAAITVAHLEAHLMGEQLDQAPAEVLTEALDDLGIRVHTSTSVSEVIGAYGELVAVRLTDGSIVSTDLMLVSCGVRPSAGLAAEAGLTVGRGSRLAPTCAVRPTRRSLPSVTAPSRPVASPGWWLPGGSRPRSWPG